MMNIYLFGQNFGSHINQMIYIQNLKHWTYYNTFFFTLNLDCLTLAWLVIGAKYRSPFKAILYIMNEFVPNALCLHK